MAGSTFIRGVALALALTTLSYSAEAKLIRAVWSCFVPCEAKGHPGEPVAYLQVAYCSATSLTPAMLENLTPLCRKKAKREDAVAVRATSADVATCVTAGNPCSDEGLTKASFSCNYVCPSQDKTIRRFTACARTGDEAWANAPQACEGAANAGGNTEAAALNCFAEGSTPCG
jgi:hypothetical protein